MRSFTNCPLRRFETSFGDSTRSSVELAFVGGRRTRALVPELEFERRWHIIDEDHLRREVAREEALRKERPDLWREREDQRRARNRERIELNRRLRAEGCRPVELAPSLKQRLKKLQQIEARRRAATAPGKLAS